MVDMLVFYITSSYRFLLLTHQKHLSMILVFCIKLSELKHLSTIEI